MDTIHNCYDAERDADNEYNRCSEIENVAT